MSYTAEQKGIVVGMHIAGMKQAEIALHVNMPTSTVCCILKKWKMTGTVVAEKSPGRPLKLSERDIRSISRTAITNRCATKHEITNFCPTEVKPCTIKKALASRGFHNHIAHKKPFLKEKHIKACLKFALKYKDWREDWKRVIWTDESTFEIEKNTR